jgi:uncharacterized membrane protein
MLTGSGLRRPAFVSEGGNKKRRDFMTIVKKSIFINAPMEKVHYYGRNPNNLVLYYDGLSEPKDISGNGEAGTVGTYRYSTMGMHFSITVKVTESALLPENCITKSEISGSFSGKMTAAGKAKDGGTEITFELEYTTPGSIFGKIADKLVLDKKQEESLQRTLENFKAQCEAE